MCDPKELILGGEMLAALFALRFQTSWTVMGLILFPGGSDSKASAYTVGDPGSTPGIGISPGEGNGNPLQYSGLENPMDGGAW